MCSASTDRSSSCGASRTRLNRPDAAPCDSPFSAGDKGKAMTLVVSRLDLTPAELREAAARTQDAKASRRMVAIALVLDGWSREAAAEACAMDRQTLRDWVHLTMLSGWMACVTSPGAAARCRAFPTNSRPRWPSGWHSVRTLSATVWCAGVASICSGGSNRSLPSRCTSTRWASCCTSYRSAESRCGRSIRKPSPRIRRTLRLLRSRARSVGGMASVNWTKRLARLNAWCA